MIYFRSLIYLLLLSKATAIGIDENVYQPNQKKIMDYDVHDTQVTRLPRTLNTSTEPILTTIPTKFYPTNSTVQLENQRLPGNTRIQGSSSNVEELAWLLTYTSTHSTETISSSNVTVVSDRNVTDGLQLVNVDDVFKPITAEESNNTQDPNYNNEQSQYVNRQNPTQNNIPLQNLNTQREGQNNLQIENQNKTPAQNNTENVQESAQPREKPETPNSDIKPETEPKVFDIYDSIPGWYQVYQPKFPYKPVVSTTTEESERLHDNVTGEGFLFMRNQKNSPQDIRNPFGIGTKEKRQHFPENQPQFHSDKQYANDKRKNSKIPLQDTKIKSSRLGNEYNNEKDLKKKILDYFKDIEENYDDNQAPYKDIDKNIHKRFTVVTPEANLQQDLIIITNEDTNHQNNNMNNIQQNREISKSMYLMPDQFINKEHLRIQKKLSNKENEQEKTLLNRKILEESSYSDEEDDLKLFLADAIRHGDTVFKNYRKNNDIFKEKRRIDELSSYSDEEKVYKKNIYKVFGYDFKLEDIN